jgi:hypothetical protein
MSVFRRGRHAETDAPEWTSEYYAELSADQPTIARRDVEGEPPWDLLPPPVDVAAGHSATWNTTGRALDVPGPAGTPARSVTPPTGPGTLPQLATPFTETVQPSPVLDRARRVLTTSPTFRWALHHLPHGELADLFDEEAPGE